MTPQRALELQAIVEALPPALKQPWRWTEGQAVGAPLYFLECGLNEHCGPTDTVLTSDYLYGDGDDASPLDLEQRSRLMTYIAAMSPDVVLNLLRAYLKAIDDLAAADSVLNDPRLRF